MKTKITMALFTVCGVLTFATGCGKQEEPERTTPPTNQTSTTAAKPAETAPTEAMQQQAATVSSSAETLTQAAEVALQEQARIQSLIDTAKNLTGQNKYAEALKVIGELSSLSLSPEQQTLVDGLKQEVEQQAAKSMAEKAAGDASKAIGGALGGPK